MKKHFEILRITRNNILKTIENLSLEELNTVPEGFKNNIIWNVAHIIVTQQLLCYKLSEVKMLVDESFVDLFKKGSEPNYKVNSKDVGLIKKKLLTLAINSKEDYDNAIFKNFKRYPTSFNVTLNTIEDAIIFNNVHEALHFGYIMAMKKVVLLLF